MKRILKSEMAEKIAFLESKSREYEMKLGNMQLQISNILGLTRENVYRDEKPAEWERIKDAISGLVGFKNGHTQGEGEIHKLYKYSVHNENAKLWYLIRSLVKDETLKPIPFKDNLRDTTSPFPENPDFTN